MLYCTFLYVCRWRLQLSFQDIYDSICFRAFGAAVLLQYLFAALDMKRGRSSSKQSVEPVGYARRLQKGESGALCSLQKMPATHFL